MRVFGAEIAAAIAAAGRDAREQHRRTVIVDGEQRSIQVPFPSPGDWRQIPIYFLMIDRFNNPAAPPKGAWNKRFDFHQGGTFKGVQAQLGYLAALGVRALWISPVLKNAQTQGRWNYHGYGAQDFLSLDPRFASDGREDTAEREFSELVDAAHARGLHVILDIVLNHAGQVFDYVRDGGVDEDFADAGLINAPLGAEPAVRWRDRDGNPRQEWENRLPPPPGIGADDAVWPRELQNHLFFRRRGAKVSDRPDWRGFVPGDFSTMRQLVVEYDATVPGQEALRAEYGPHPVLNILIRAHQYLIARFDIDGFRIDTVKYVHPEAVETFGNAMREFALSIGKQNFFTFGEIYDDEPTIAAFIGRNGGSGEGYGVDAALDFPLFFKLPRVAKGFEDVAAIRNVFEERKRQEGELLSSHGEAGRFFVSFLDNHDQHERIAHPQTPQSQVLLAVGLLFTLQGIPCLYYGTEQGLSGTIDDSGNPDLSSNESSREALWGKPAAFDTGSPMFRQVQAIATLRAGEPALCFGRLYFREVSGNGSDFGHSSGTGGLVAFSRILSDREIVVIANTGSRPFYGSVLIDRHINATPRQMRIGYSNTGSTGQRTTRSVPAANFFHRDGTVSHGEAAVLDVTVQPSEIIVFVPV
ncbi:MAG: alpha-amylase family glycosyl hydrolase [Alphaproteobacteria bacterium]